MAVNYVATKDTITTGTALKTLGELQTTSTVRVTVFSWWCEFNGTISTNAPILVQLARASAGITGTTLAAVKYDDFGPTANTTFKHSASGEGTLTDILESHYVNPTTGLIVQYPLGRELKIPVSGFLRVMVTAASGSVSACVGFAFEE